VPAKQAIDDKLQGSVAAYLRCGGVVNNQMKKGLLMSLWVEKIQEAQLSSSDRAMRIVSSNLANYHATVQKLLIRPFPDQTDGMKLESLVGGNVL